MPALTKEILLTARPRGFHLITREIVDSLPELANISAGILQVFIKHTSASICINENADPDVRLDMEFFFRKYVPENEPYFIHTVEGPDDMPAHIKSVLLGSSISVPVKNGRLQLGTWQGIYLGEHRERGGQRRIILTVVY